MVDVMTDLNSNFTDDILVGTPQTISVLPDTPIKPFRFKRQQFQFDATGAGTLEIKTKIVGQSALNVQTSISGETIILDLVGVEEFLVTATNATVPLSIFPYRQGEV